MTADVALSASDVSARYGAREVFRAVGFQLAWGQSLGVIGANGAGKTTLLRMLAGLLSPAHGELRIGGAHPRRAVSALGVAYYAGEATLPGAVRACGWGSLGSGGLITAERRRLRTLSRGTRQLLGLRTVLGRQGTRVILLDEPWESLDSDACRWLSSTLTTKRDRGAAIVLTSHRLHDLAGICDLYLFLVNHRGAVLHAHEIAPVGTVSDALLADVFERLRGTRTVTQAV